MKKSLSHTFRYILYWISPYKTEADILPDHEAGTLTVRLHHSANASTDAVIQKLCDKLNETETLFPRTNLRLIYNVG